jgi:Dyp-type peroxidase family
MAAELEDMQGLLRSGFGTLPSAAFSLFELGTVTQGRRLLLRLADDVTTAAMRDAAVVTQVALTASGLRALDTPASVVEQFALEFQAGMAAPARSRFLGDDPATWSWGAPGGPRVDVLVCSYARTDEELATALQRVQTAAAECHAHPVATLRAELADTEPFGFRDGISGPFVAELSSSSRAGREQPVALGEFVLGYPNAYGLLTQRPVLHASQDPDGLLPALAPGVDEGNPQGGADLGRNGSYLVLRTLAQDVEAFDAYVAEQAAAAEVDPELLAAKMVGRWRSGAPLVTSPDHDDPGLADANDFGYHDTDPAGLRCPFGAHIRRANPRESLDPRPGSATSQAVTDRHRLLRRGRRYADETEQGLHFLALNGNLGRQFEFVQHTWLDNPKFAGLYDDVDPVVGTRRDRSLFTVPDQPLRRRYAGLPQFVSTRGGAYLFLPGLRALRYLCDPR